MHAIILSAGRGSRLLPLTEDLPKCLLPIGLTTVLGMQLDTLFNAGIEKVSVVTGFNAKMVEAEINARPSGPKVKIIYNPFYQVADNLASCWMARKEMKPDFLLINGDTLFSPELLEKVLSAPANPIAENPAHASVADDNRAVRHGLGRNRAGGNLSVGSRPAR